MLDCFRTGGANNPETFVTAIAATLARYPDQVIYDVTDPRSGLPSQLSWMPTIKDVRDACDRAYHPIKDQIERERRIAEQLAEREQDGVRQARPTLDQLKEKYGPNWGIPQPDERPKSNFKAPTPQELRAHYQKFGLEFEPKTAHIINHLIGEDSQG